MFPQNRLTSADIDSASPRQKPYKLFDGGALYIEVLPSGSKCWRLKYRFKGKEKRLSFGIYPSISIEGARELRDKAKLALNAGYDPAELNPSEQNAQQIHFRLTMDSAGALTIDTANQQLRLTAEQTAAVGCFISSNMAKSKSNVD